MKRALTAKSLVPILADKFDVPEPTALMIDRALADAGFRRKGKGRNWPSMSRSEALVFLLACMAARKPTHAAEEVRGWVTARARLESALEADDDDLEWYGGEAQWHRSDDYAEIKCVIDMIRGRLPAATQKGGKATLVEVLLAVCALIERKEVEAESFTLEVNKSEGCAQCSIKTKRTEFAIEFKAGMSVGRRKPTPAAITSVSTVSGDALVEILARTEEEAEA